MKTDTDLFIVLDETRHESKAKQCGKTVNMINSIIGEIQLGSHKDIYINFTNERNRLYFMPIFADLLMGGGIEVESNRVDKRIMTVRYEDSVKYVHFAVNNKEKFAVLYEDK